MALPSPTPDRPVIDHRYAPAATWTSICRPDDPHKTVVREDGALLHGFRSDNTVDWSFDRAIELRASTTHAPVQVRQWTEDARTPIVVTELTYPHLTLTLRAAGHLTRDDERADLVAWHLAVHDDAPRGLTTGLHVDIHQRDARYLPPRWHPSHAAVAFPPDAPPAGDMFVDDDRPTDAADLAAAEVGRCLVSFPVPLVSWHPTGYRPASAVRTVPQVVDPGDELDGVLVVPLTGPAPADIDERWARDALEAERGYWRGLAALELPVQVPDADLQAMLVSAARNLLQARDLDEQGRPLFQIGPTMYRSVFMVDGYFLIETARLLGLDEDADHAVGVLLDKVRPDGSVNFMAEQLPDDAYPHHKETGIAVATIVRQWELTGDDAALRARWSTVRDAVGFIARLREQAQALPEDHPAHGLMPPAYTDGGLSGVRGELSTALWTLIGLESAVRAAEVVAREDLAHLTHEAAALRCDLTRVLERQLATDHAAIMALDPTEAHHTIPGRTTASAPHRINPGTGTWAFAQAVYPGQLLAADHPTVTRYLDLLERSDDEQGVPAETGWLPYRALWTYYASFAGHAWLHCGRPDKAVDYLYAFANHASPTRVWREEQPLSHTGDDTVFGDMPHNWASAELIRLVRNLLVLERHTGVELLAGLPDHWLVPGDPVRIATPTAFGRVEVAVHVDDAGTAGDTRPRSGRIVVTTGPGGARSGAVAVRVPTGTWTVELDGAASTVTGPQLLELGTLDRGELTRTSLR